MWKRQDRIVSFTVNILVLHSIVFVDLFAVYQLGQTTAVKSIYAMLYRTCTWVAIYSLLRWRKGDGQ